MTSHPRYESQACETSLAKPKRRIAMVTPPTTRRPVVRRAKKRKTSFVRAADGDIATSGIRDYTWLSDLELWLVTVSGLSQLLVVVV
jgi:hypothetical protein